MSDLNNNSAVSFEELENAMNRVTLIMKNTNESFDGTIKLVNTNTEKFINIFNLIRNIDTSKFVNRRILHKNRRYENDAEHSYVCATLVMALDDLIPSEIDKYKVIQLLLVHDLVEVLHGDTWYLASREEKENKKIGELNSANELFKDNPKFMNLWLEYEERKTPESIIAKQIDIIQAVCTIVLHDGETWKSNKVSKEDEMNFSKWIHQNNTPLGDFLSYVFKYAEDNNLFYNSESE